MDVYLKSSFITFVVINGMSSVAASVMNFLVILTFVKTPSLRRPSYILILSLAITDFGVGAVLQPSYAAHLFARLGNNRWLTSLTSYVWPASFWPVVSASFLLISVITADRFLALKLHLRYQEIVTTKRTSFVVLTVVIISASTLLFRLYSSAKIAYLVFACAVLLLDVFLMTRISQTISKHSKQIGVQGQMRETGIEEINIPRYKKSINTMYYIMVVFVVCHTPLIVTKIIQESGYSTKNTMHAWVSIQLINSAMNPIIYFWRIPDMRSTVVRLIQRIDCSRCT